MVVLLVLLLPALQLEQQCNMTQILKELQQPQLKMLLAVLSDEKLFEYVKNSNGYILTQSLTEFIRRIVRQDGYPPFWNGTEPSPERNQLNGIREAYLKYNAPLIDKSWFE